MTLSKDRIQEALKEFGLPRLIIAGFLVVLFVAAPFVGVSMPATMKDICNRFGQNELLTLAMVPMILSGAGLKRFHLCSSAISPKCLIMDHMIQQKHHKCKILLFSIC